LIYRLVIYAALVTLLAEFEDKPRRRPQWRAREREQASLAEFERLAPTLRIFTLGARSSRSRAIFGDVADIIPDTAPCLSLAIQRLLTAFCLTTWRLPSISRGCVSPLSRRIGAGYQRAAFGAKAARFINRSFRLVIARHGRLFVTLLVIEWTQTRRRPPPLSLQLCARGRDFKYLPQRAINARTRAAPPLAPDGARFPLADQTSERCIPASCVSRTIARVTRALITIGYQ